mgnify:CR=1 FL=1
MDRATRMKDMERRNARLKKQLAEVNLGKTVPREKARPNC